MTDIPEINPLMRQALPAMVERLSAARMGVADLVRPAADDMDALADFLAFEADKVGLALEKAEWSSRADAEPLKKRLDYLRAVAELADSDRFKAMLSLIDEVLDMLGHLREETA